VGISSFKAGKRKPSKREMVIGGISLAITIALCIFIVHHRSYLEEISHWGYIGCFTINILASGTIVMPGFGALLTFTLGGVLNPAIVGAVAGIGETLGALGAYFTGYNGRHLFRSTEEDSFYMRMDSFFRRHGSKGVFFMAAIFNPIFYPFAVALGMFRFKLIQFFLATWAGRTVKNMILAYLGYLGLHSILKWIGLDF
jgi:membrane protein DedA with SNARE-associated domain